MAECFFCLESRDWVRQHRQCKPMNCKVIIVPTEYLACISLHWFDKAFHAKDGPAHGAKAVLVRYADDFVVMARYAGDDLQRYFGEKIEGWLGLKINP
jgi:hypothetical protein